MMTNHARFRRAGIVISILLTWVLAGSCWAQASYRIAKTPDTVVLRWTRIPAELEAPDAGTTATIYADGRMVVEFPAFSPRAGRHQLRLSEPELDALIGGLLDDGVMAFDATALEDSGATSAYVTGDPGTSGVRFHTADADLTRLSLHVVRYTPAGGASRTDVDKTVALRGLQFLPARHPSNDALAGLARAERQMVEWIGSDRLVKLP